MEAILLNVGLFILGFVLGFLLALWVYRNNTKQVKKLVDTVNDLKDQVKNIKG